MLGDAEPGEAVLKDFKKQDAGFASNTLMMSLGEEITCMAVEQFAKEKGISANTLFLGAFAYALGKYSGENKSLFCTVNNGRHSARISESVGMFVRTLPIFQSWDETVSVENYLKKISDRFL